MLPAITWLTYAVPAYVLATIIFRVRYGKSPVAHRFPPRRLYDAMDLGLGVCLLAYSVWVFLPPAPRAIWAPGGVGAVALGIALRAWALGALGPNWRMGQDPSDTTTVFVTTGPYRFLRHPINTALVIVAVGQALLTGLDARAVFLLAFSTLYGLVQGRAEARYWAGRRQRAPGSSSVPP